MISFVRCSNLARNVCRCSWRETRDYLAYRGRVAPLRLEYRERFRRGTLPGRLVTFLMAHALESWPLHGRVGRYAAPQGEPDGRRDAMVCGVLRFCAPERECTTGVARIIARVLSLVLVSSRSYALGRLSFRGTDNRPQSFMPFAGNPANKRAARRPYLKTL